MNIQDTLDERKKTHGDYFTHAETTQLLKEVAAIQVKRVKKKLKAEHQEALDMIFHKIGRIIAGDPNFEDHWHDIAGYAELARKACSSAPKSNPHTAESTPQSDHSSGECIPPLASRHNGLRPPSPSGHQP